MIYDAVRSAGGFESIVCDRTLLRQAGSQGYSNGYYLGRRVGVVLLYYYGGCVSFLYGRILVHEGCVLADSRYLGSRHLHQLRATRGFGCSLGLVVFGGVIPVVYRGEDICALSLLVCVTGGGLLRFRLDASYLLRRVDALLGRFVSAKSCYSGSRGYCLCYFRCKRLFRLLSLYGLFFCCEAGVCGVLLFASIILDRDGRDVT